MNIIQIYRQVSQEFIQMVTEFKAMNSTKIIEIITLQSFSSLLKFVCYFAEKHFNVFIPDLCISIIDLWTHFQHLNTFFTSTTSSHLSNDSPSNLKHCKSLIQSIIDQYLKIPQFKAPKPKSRQISVQLTHEKGQIKIHLNHSPHKTTFPPIKIKDEIPHDLREEDDDNIFDEKEYFEFLDRIGQKDNDIMLISAIILFHLSKNAQNFESIFLKSEKWKILFEILIFMSKKVDMVHWKEFCRLGNFLVVTMSNFVKNACRDVEVYNSLVQLKIIKELCGFIKKQTQILLQDTTRTEPNMFRMSLLYLCEMTSVILFESIHLSEIHLKEFENTSGYEIIHILFILTVKSNHCLDHEAIVFESQKMMQLLQVFCHFNHNLTDFLQHLMIQGEEIKTLTRFDQNDALFPILLGLFESAPMSILLFDKIGFCVKSQLLQLILEILNKNKYQYLESLHRFKPFLTLRKAFPNLTPKMQKSIISCVGTYKMLFLEISEWKVNIDTWSKILFRDISEYLGIISKSTPNASFLVIQDCKRQMELMKNLYRSSGMTGHLIHALKAPLHQRSTLITCEILELMLAYFQGNLLNQQTLLIIKGSLEVLFDLLYDRNLLERALNVIVLVAINDGLLQFNIVQDLLKMMIPSDRIISFTTSDIELYDYILESVKEILKENRNAKDAFRRGNGFETMVKTLEFLSTSNADRSHIFKVLQSVIMCTNIALDQNEANQKYFDKIQFASFFSFIHRLKFMHTYQFGSQLVLNLFSLAFLKPDFYKEDLLIKGLDKPNEFEELFADKISSSICLFVNPSVITDIILPLISKDLDLIDIHLIQMTLGLIQSSCENLCSNRNRLTKVDFITRILSDFGKVVKDPKHPLQKSLLQLFIIMSSHHISTQQLFSLFSHLTTNFDNLMDCLIFMSKRNFVPNHYLNFVPNEKHQYLLIPKISISPFPPIRGYTMNLWFRVENWTSEYDKKILDKELIDGIYIYKLSTQDSFQIEGILTREGNFSLKLSDGYQEEYMIFKNFKFEKKKWYSIGISHYMNTTPSIVHTFTLYVNGKYREKVGMTYKNPSMFRLKFFKTPFLEEMILGTKRRDINGKASWQLGNVHFLEGIPSDSDQFMMYHLGANYIGNFSETNLSHYFSNEMVNDWSVSTFPQTIYSMRDSQLNLTHLSESVIFVFSAEGAMTGVKLILIPRTLDKQEVTQDDDFVDVSGHLSSHGKRSALGVWKSSEYNFGEYLRSSRLESLGFTPIQTVVIGDVELVSTQSFKNNLVAIGGLTTILGFFNHVETAKRRVRILQLISYLIKYNNLNAQEMDKLNGYDLVAYLLSLKNFEVKNSVLKAIFHMAGIKVPFSKEISEVLHVPTLLSKGVVSNPNVLEKILLDFGIWKRAPLETQKMLFQGLLYLVQEHPQRYHHVTLFRNIGLTRRLLFILQPYNLSILGSDNEITSWPKDLIKPTIEIFYEVIPTPWIMKYFFPVYTFILSTHPMKQSLTSKKTKFSAGTRKAILTLAYDLMKSSSNEVLDEIQQYLNATLLIGLLDNPSSSTRVILLKILFLLFDRLESIRDIMNKIDGFALITYQMMNFTPQIQEFQIFFDMMLGQQFEDVIREKKRFTNDGSACISDSDDEDVVEILKKDFVDEAMEEIKEIKKKPVVKKDILIKNRQIEDIKNPSILLLIFRLICKLETTLSKKTIIKALAFIFASNSIKVKNVLATFEIHKNLVDSLDVKFIQGDTELLDMILDFLVNYLIFIMENKTNGDTILSEVLDSFQLLGTCQIQFVQNLQRYVLNGLLKHFSSTRTATTKWEMMFAKYCKCATEHVLQWFDLTEEKVQALDLSDNLNESFESPRKIANEIKTNLSSNLCIYDTRLTGTTDRNNFVKRLNLVRIEPILDLKTIRASLMEETPKNYSQSKRTKFVENGLKAQQWLDDIIGPHSYFQYKPFELNGFVFWLMETIRTIISQSRKGSYDFLSSIDAEYILMEQFKRLTLYLLDFKNRNFEQMSFALLNLLFTYKGIANGQYAVEFTLDQVFTTRFICKTVDHFQDVFLSILTKKVWIFVCQSGKEYLRDIFPLNQLNMDVIEKEFVPSIASIISFYPEFANLIIENNIKEGIQRMNEADSVEIGNKLNSIILAVKGKIRSEQENVSNLKSKLSEASVKLQTLQYKFQKPSYAEKQRLIEREKESALHWKKLNKTLATEVSIWNTETNVKIDNLNESLVDYTSKIWNFCWKLDPTEGPNRQRIRLKLKQNLIGRPNIATNQKRQQVFLEEKVEMETDDNDFQLKGELKGGDKIQGDPYQCTKVTPHCKYEGDLVIGTKALIFSGVQVNHNSKSTQLTQINGITPKISSFAVQFDEIKDVQKRRYLFIDSAIEVFLTNGKTIFLAFNQKNERDRILSSLADFGNIKPSSNDIYSITKKWQEGQLSNFDYLIQLNSFAGRSFNDLTQYPVFPHIIADYTSPTLDLNDPRTFRDLSKNMGCLNEERQRKAQDQYQNLVEAGERPFHWGTHYCTRMTALFYLIRLEPFTRCFWELNGGLDIPDRIFHSMQKSFELSSSVHSKSDVKELIPECFYLPSIFVNSNRINFGVMQNSNFVDNVELPAWCSGDPILFVRMHREALESEYVSQNLHLWVDLIFGYKQLGEAAVQSVNVFHPYTYEGSNDEIGDEITKDARWHSINHWGQTPKQIFKKQHPTRKIMVRSEEKMFFNVKEYETRDWKESIGDLIINDDSMLFVAEKNKIFLPEEKSITCAVIDWNRTIRILKWDTNKTITTIQHGIRSESFLCASLGTKLLAIGTNIGCIHLFQLNKNLIFHSFSGHKKRVLCICLSEPWGIIASGSQDGACILWDIHRFSFYKKLDHLGPVFGISINPTTGDMLVCSQFEKEYHLNLYTLNGDLIKKIVMLERPTTIKFTWNSDGISKNVIVVGMMNGKVLLLDSFDLSIYKELKSEYHTSAISSIAINPMMNEIVSGDEKGHVVVWSTKKKK